ncbi:hypothetical protein F4781DRAFT_395791 [Annulohypoxylon bovei var. microspora]|nr:hypothetical protein F4781DRAFT_395791 [Annulohypoxylon bovei var. microspora]
MDSSNNDSNGRKLVIGIDFGTTYSGIAWASSDRPDRTINVTDWPNSRESEGGVSSPKVPSLLRYLNDGQFEWGFQISDDADPQDILSLFKLGLEPEKYIKQSADAFGKSLHFENVDQMITDYLSGLFKYFTGFMERQIGQGMFQTTPVKFVLTVPAIWSEVAKQRTLDAFERVPNLPKSYSINLLSEPEAAGIASLREIDQHDLKINDTFVTVDGGGGTVDLITYTITSLHPVLEVVEASEGTGDLCGSSRLNERFAEFITSRLGGEEGWDEDVLHSAVEHFDRRVKRVFSMSSLTENRDFIVDVPGLGRNSQLGIFRPGRLSLKAEEIHLFFEPDMIRVIQLVKEQIAMSNVPIRKILLVGGYGASIYLRERLQIAIREDSSIMNNIEILQPPNSWVSVVNGAVMKGLSLVVPVNYDVPIVKARTGRKHYGYKSGNVWDPHQHESLRTKKYYDGYSGCWRVSVMDWIIKRGELVSENKPFLQTYYYTWPVKFGRIRSISINVYADEVSKVAPLERDSNVKVLCKLTANLDHIAEDKLEKTLGVDEEMYYVLETQVEAVYRSASTEYTLIYKGQRYDTVTAEYV